jgi:hypothetical protein
MRMHLPVRQCPSTLCQPSKSLSWSAVSRQMDWVRGSCCVASQITRFDPFRFLSMGVLKGLGIMNEYERCGWTAAPNNCSLCHCYTSVAVKHLVRGGVPPGHLLGHQLGICADGICGNDQGTSTLGNFLHLSVQFPCYYLYQFRKYKILLLVEILPGTL